MTPIVPAVGADALFYVETDFQNNPESLSGGIRYDQWWKPDGSQAWTCRDSSDRVDAHEVDPPWSITPGDWTNRKTKTGVGSPISLYVTPDGTKFITMTAGGSQVVQSQVMSTPFDPSTASGLVSKFLSNSTLNMRWAEDGLTMWTSRLGFINEFTVGTAFDVSTINAVPAATFDTVGELPAGNPQTMGWSSDGTRLYMVNISTKDLVSYTASTPFDITTLGDFAIGPDVDLPTAIGVARGLFYRIDNGDIHLEQDQNFQRMKVFSVVLDPDIDDYSFATAGTFTISGNNHLTPIFNIAGDRVYFSRSTSVETWQYNMSTPGDMSTISFELTHNWGTTQFQRGLTLNKDRSKAYKIRTSGGGGDFFVSADPFSVTEMGNVAGGNPYTMTGVSALAGIATPVTPVSFVVTPDDLNLFVQSADVGDRAIYHYLMSVAGDAGTATFQAQALDVSSEFDTNLFTIVYTPDGSKLFVVGTNSGAVIIAQYDMNTAYDVNTAVYSGKQITVTPGSTVLLGLFVWANPSGGFQFNLTYPTGGASNGSAWSFDRYDAP